MAVRWPSGVPVTDLSLVLGDTVPVRIRVDHALTDCTPALAVKQTIGSADLIMTVTDWTREDDWQTADWVINTVPLQTALGSADRTALVAELVLIAPDGAQHTSRPIRVTVRRDMLPAEFAPPAEVLADWSELVASALAAQLPDALTAAGMHVDPVAGSSTLSTGPADTWTPVSLYALTWGDELLAGNLTDSCRLRQVTMTALRASTSTASHWLRVLLGKDGNYTQIGISSPVTAPVAGQSVTWDFTPGISLNRGDKIMLEICTGADAGNAVRTPLDLHVVNTPVKDGRGICTSDGYPAVVTDGTMAPMMTVMVDYDDGVSVGGVDVATVTQVQVLGADVRTAAVNSQAAAQSATAARDQAQAIADNMTISAGSVTTGAPGTQAAITLTPGATPGSWVMSATIPRGDVGAPGADADLTVTDARYGQLAAANAWVGVQRYHGLVDYYQPVTMWQGLEVQGNLYCAGNISGTFDGTFTGTVEGSITPQSRLDFAATRGGQIRYYLTCVSGGQMMSLYATGGSSPTLVLSATRGGMSIPGTLAVAGAINANGGVRVPLPSTSKEALSCEAMIERMAANDWRRMTRSIDTARPSWVASIVQQLEYNAGYRVGTPNASVKPGFLGNDICDHLVTMTAAAGVSLIGRSTSPWQFADFLGNYRNADYAVAAVWRIVNSDKASVLLGSTSSGYITTTATAAACYAHPIHWCDYNLTGADYRYPLINNVNGVTNREMSPAWQATIYGKDYLGSATSCLIRGTDYGRDVGDQQYIWALVPPATWDVRHIAVAMTLRQSGDHANVLNRWALFIDGHYVMPMTSLFCGSGHTASISVKVKAHEVGNTLQVGLRMGGARIDADPAVGINNVWPIMERVVMRDATVKPVPTVEASTLEVAAAGGEVTLTVSSALTEDVYVINDTMCGHDSAAVWCTQSSEQIPSGGGQITLTLAANTTGQPRQVWTFAGHHYAQAAVIKINQLA